MSYDEFSGQIPESLCTQRKLEDLLLIYNDFSGPIPSDLGRCTSMIYGSSSISGAQNLTSGHTFKNSAKKEMVMSKWRSFHKQGFSELETVHCLKEDNVIRSGSWGKVYKVELSNSEIVAVEKLGKNEIYSFGVVILELVTGKPPIDPAAFGEKGLVRLAFTTLDQKGSIVVIDPKNRTNPLGGSAPGSQGGHWVDKHPAHKQALHAEGGEDAAGIWEQRGRTEHIGWTNTLPINGPSMRKVVKMLQGSGNNEEGYDV
ncbi:hypothetical protein SAY86_019240 [Trapa natans]|uniref:Uncharacterized protein n=1 Tax=Trapa natans TaxID=22666 RepID=A0AAN7LE42_TRANT|nr:hypothetical protein SAY86_019240 [Trapa natans]